MSDPDETLREVGAELYAKGYRWHFIGHRHTFDDGITRFWFNGSQYGEGRGQLTGQPSGWYTIEELRAEKFAEGMHLRPGDLW